MPEPNRPPGADGVLGLLRVVDGGLHVGIGAVLVRIEEGGEAGDLVRVQQAALDGDEGDQHGADEQQHQDADRQTGDGQHHDEDDHHDHGRAEVGLEQHEDDGDAGHDQQAEHVAPGQPLFISSGAIGGDGQDEGEDGELGGLELERAQAEPAGRALGAAAHGEDAEQGQDDQPVQQRGHGFEAAVVEHGEHDHDDDAQDDEEPLLLQEGLRVVPRRQQRPARGRVDHDDADERHQQRCPDQHEVERGDAAAGGNACSGECGHIG